MMPNDVTSGLRTLAQGTLQFRVAVGQDLVEAFDEVDVDWRVVFVAEFGDLAGGLDAGETSAADDDLSRGRRGSFAGRF